MRDGDTVVMIGWAPDDFVTTLVVEVIAVSYYESRNSVLSSDVGEKEEADSVTSSVLGEEILEKLSGDGVGAEGVAVGDEKIPVGVGAARDSERVGDFRI